MLGEGPTDDINSSVVTAEKRFSINFRKTKKKFYFNLHCNGGNSYLFVNGNEIYMLKPGEVLFKENLYDFSVDYNVIDKSDILKIHKYLMVKNNTK